MSKLLIITLIFNLFLIQLNAQNDSLYRRRLRISTGYKDYSSVNEIFNPYIYTATSVMFSAEYSKRYERSKISYSFGYTHLNTHPKDLPVPASYEVVSKENGRTYVVYENQDEVMNVHTTYFEARIAYYHEVINHLFTNDALSFGLSSDNLFILSPSISQPEMIALSLSPGLIYELYIKHGFRLAFENQISLLAVTIQRPYAGAEAQLDDKNDFHFYANYVLHQSKVSSVNRYFLFSSQLTLEKEISPRVSFMARYGLRFQEMKKTRRYESAETALNLGVVFKFR